MWCTLKESLYDELHEIQLGNTQCSAIIMILIIIDVVVMMYCYCSFKQKNVRLELLRYLTCGASEGGDILYVNVNLPDYDGPVE